MNIAKRYREALLLIVHHDSRGDISSEAVRDLMAAEAWSALREVDGPLRDDIAIPAAFAPQEPTS